MASVSPPLAPRESIPLAPMHLWHAWHSVTSRLRLRGRCGAHGTGLSGGALGCSWCRCRRGSDVYIATVAHRDNWRHVCLAWSCPLVWAPLSPPLAPSSPSLWLPFTFLEQAGRWHPRCFCVAGVAQMVLGWVGWRAWARLMRLTPSTSPLSPPPPNFTRLHSLAGCCWRAWVKKLLDLKRLLDLLWVRRS